MGTEVKRERVVSSHVPAFRRSYYCYVCASMPRSQAKPASLSDVRPIVPHECGKKGNSPAGRAAGELMGRSCGTGSQGTVESYFWPLSTGGAPLWSCGTPTSTAPEQ